MTDPKIIAGIFNDFTALYQGKGSQMGIKPLLKKYDNHPMLLGLLSYMDEAAKVPVLKVIKEAYEVYKVNRNRELGDKDWENIVDWTREISLKWKDNKWCNRILIELICLLEADEKERKQIAKEVQKEMEDAAKTENHAA